MTEAETKLLILRNEIRKPTSIEEKFINSDKLAKEVNLAKNHAAGEVAYTTTRIASVFIKVDNYPL